MQSGFMITNGKGFRVTFENGWALSVQFGNVNYCENRANFRVIYKDDAEYGNIESPNAEIAIINPNGELEYIAAVQDTVKGYVSPAEMLRIMNDVANR